MNKFILFISMLCSVSLFAAATKSMESFNKRFSFKRNSQGELVAIKVNTFTKRFSLKPFVNQIKSDLEEQVSRMNQKSLDSQLEIDELIDFISEQDLNNTGLKSSDVDDRPRVVRRSLRNLKNIKLDSTFSGIRKHRVLRKFELDFKKVFKMLDLSIIADPSDARFFYRKQVTYEVVKKALNFAKKKLDNVPMLNLASYVIVKVHDMVLEQRIFNQNVLLHYLENFTEEELGLTKDEYDRVLSSIYESRIAPINFRESKMAAENWSSYGADKFFTAVRMANTRVRRSAHNFERSPVKLNYSFVTTFIDGNKKILNTVDTTHSFNGKMPIAYHYDNPNKVKRFRSLLNLANLGLGFLPLPGWIKSNVQGFVESFYENQQRTEGSLVGYFESSQDEQMLNNIKSQIRNPYFKL